MGGNHKVSSYCEKISFAFFIFPFKNLVKIQLYHLPHSIPSHLSHVCLLPNSWPTLHPSLLKIHINKQKYNLLSLFNVAYMYAFL